MSDDSKNCVVFLENVLGATEITLKQLKNLNQKRLFSNYLRNQGIFRLLHNLLKKSDIENNMAAS